MKWSFFPLKAPDLRLSRVTLASVLATIVNLALCSAVLASSPNGATYCMDVRTGILYPSALGRNANTYFPYWYSQIRTNNFSTEGAKGNLSTAGYPYTWDDVNQHIDVYLSANENTSQMRWVQVGWNLGQLDECGNEVSNNPPVVYVEIFDDSSNPCYVAVQQAAPSNASYDARYYATVGGQYEYHVFFEVPGSNNIQYLAYGDFNSLYTDETAAGEALAPDTGSSWPNCPVLGQTTVGDWNYLGQQASSPTFAAELQLYNNGSWADWAVPTTTTVNAPYQLQPVSNFGGGNYSEFKNGGGQE